MELKEGMYVRTKNGYIRKIDRVWNDTHFNVDRTYYNCDIDEDTLGCILDEDIIGEPSYNIIDLIEVGDYVNGEKVDIFEIPPDYEEEELGFPLYDEDSDYFHRVIIAYTPLKQVEIKSIVTKEQFESMSYKVGE